MAKSLPLLWSLGGGGAVLEQGKNKSPNTAMGSLDLREEECPWPWGCQGAAPVCPAPSLPPCRLRNQLLDSEAPGLESQLCTFLAV